MRCLVDDPVRVVAGLVGVDPDVMDRDELAGVTQQIAALRGWCESLQVRVTRRQRALAGEGRGEAPRDLLAREGRTSGREARAADERERVCSALPSFEVALGGGAVSSGHLDAIAVVTRGLDEGVQAEFFAHGEGLLADALRLGVDGFERNCRDLARHLVAVAAGDGEVVELERQRAASKVSRWVDRESGMRYTQIVLDPVRDAVLAAALDRARRRVRQRAGNGVLEWNQIQVDAVLDALAASGEAGSGERVVELSVLIDHATLIGGLHAGSLCELADGTPLPVATLRQMACDAEIVPIVLGGDRRALDVGRGARLATRAQRQALRAMHRSCVHPDCTVPFEECRIHHIVPWEHGGRTEIDNLVPLCETAGHHHLVHEGHWNFTMTPDRTGTWTRPDGTTYWIGTTIDRTPSDLRSRHR